MWRKPNNLNLKKSSELATRSECHDFKTVTSIKSRIIAGYLAKNIIGFPQSFKKLVADRDIRFLGHYKRGCQILHFLFSPYV